MKLETVIRIWRELNHLNFGGVLRQPIIKFTRSRFVDGFFDSTRVMAFNLADTKGFAAVTELVYHEMIHQYIEEYLGLKCDDDHGKEFKKQYNKFSFGIQKDTNYEI